MATLFIPTDTKGLWDASSRRLTVYIGEPASIGIRGVGRELETANFSMAEPGGNSLSGLMNYGGEYRYQIDTSRRRQLVFTVSSREGRDLAQKIAIWVVERPNYAGTAPIGQMDSNACWAACLEWWLRATPGRQPITQKDMMVKAAKIWNQDGTINPGALSDFIRRNPTFAMTTREVTPPQLDQYMGYWPLIIGFKAPGGFGHMNVLMAQDRPGGPVDAMEPWFPDPDFAGPQWVYDDASKGNGPPPYYNKNTGDAFRFTGTIVKTAYARYSHSPMATGRFWLGFPSEYLAQIDGR